jgi:hypothetical protein
MTHAPRQVGDFSGKSYLTYPHANGFAEGGRYLVTGRVEDGQHSLWRHELSTGREVRVGALPTDANSRDPLWFDVARDAGRLVAVANNEVWLFDVINLGAPILAYREAPGAGELHSLPSISADGARIAMVRRVDNRYEVVEITVEGGSARVLFSMPWFASHVHFSPHDESWIGFCHEGAADRITDRVWAWHGDLCPAGACLFDQRPQGLWFGHERWAFHTTSVYAVCYGTSPGGPRGIYELFLDGRPARLISEGNRDWHLNVSHDGRCVVVDTTGPHDQPGCGWENAGNISDIILIEVETGKRTFVARSGQSDRHPCHPHPVFDPSGHSIFYNEATQSGGGCKIMCIPNPLMKSGVGKPPA